VTSSNSKRIKHFNKINCTKSPVHTLQFSVLIVLFPVFDVKIMAARQVSKTSGCRAVHAKRTSGVISKLVFFTVHDNLHGSSSHFSLVLYHCTLILYTTLPLFSGCSLIYLCVDSSPSFFFYTKPFF
jgi:hypothetical protein